MSDQPAAAHYQPHVIIDEQRPSNNPLEGEQNQAAAAIKEKGKLSDKSMDVKVYSPFKDYYTGPAFSVSAENTTGPFDILPGHHNFITLLSASEVVVRYTGGEQKIQISGGIMHVKADKVIVFLDV